MAKHVSATKMKIPSLEVPELLLTPVSGAPSGSAPAGKLAMTTTGKLYANPTVGDNWVSVLATIDELSDFGITSTPAEINILDGASLDVDELNILDGVTATTDEINYLDNDDLTADDLQKLADLTASAAEVNTLASSGISNADLVKLAAVTSDSTELNQLDGVTVGGTSAGDIATIDDTQTFTNKSLTEALLSLPEYTQVELDNGTTLNVATYDGYLVRCSDGDSGSECLAYSNGTNWKVIALGANIDDGV